ncbi:AraC-like DNA-binding protein [Lipingzhangella halophila]|uniref:AraC-like DNA-binding protein n=1 Tax=Lipingzhangella halophila TaxID=1783352 RepID=A0A7W7RP41_9ACTN|nr:helix-turn-helix domain-containing protein [Lipingzhangella halophila]MBB4935589.1 AraC-like DNA-binding protein [Lipingzhangella halophila]
MYQERASHVVSAVVWHGTATSPAEMGHRVLPDGCMDLLWADGTLWVAGPDTVGYVAPWPEGTRFSGVRFSPGTAPLLLGVAAHEVRDRVLPLADIVPAAHARRLTEFVGQARHRESALEEIAAGWAARADPPDPRIQEVVRLARAGMPVTAMADTVGVGERRLHRWCRAAFGYGPKTLARILRMNRALTMARGGTPLAAVAAAAGYADQAHLGRDFRALADAPPSALIQ